VCEISVTLSQKNFGTSAVKEIPACDNLMFREISQYDFKEG
jgi:hypothetical protein